MTLYPVYEIRKAVCPECGEEINEDDDVLFAAPVKLSGLAPQPEPRHREHGIAPPMTPRRRVLRWQCPACRKGFTRKQLEFIVMNEEK